MIDEKHIKLAICGLKEESLAVVGVIRANVNEPREPEIDSVANAPKAIAGQDFQNSPILPTQELGTEAQACRWTNAPLTLPEPAVLKRVQEGVGEDERLPIWDWKAAGAIKLASGALVE